MVTFRSRVLTVRWIFLENFQEMPGFEQIRFFRIFETNNLIVRSFSKSMTAKRKNNNLPMLPGLQKDNRNPRNCPTDPTKGVQILTIL